MQEDAAATAAPGAERRRGANAPSAPQLRSTIQGERLELAAAGFWTAEHARAIESLVEAATAQHPSVRQVVIDMAEVDHLDTFGAWLLERLARTWHGAGYETTIVGLAERYHALLREVHNVNRVPPPPPRPERRIHDRLEIVGRATVNAARSLVNLLDMFGAVAVAAARVLVRPATFRLTSVVHHLDQVGFRAMPIVLLITFLIGCIIAQQGVFHFRNFGAEVYVVDMVGVLVLREMGVLIVAIMVAGRSGSAYTAEIGSMEMREEVDALKTMGIDPVEVLILPRIVAMVIALPLLTVLGDLAALYGAALVSWIYGGISPDVFMARLREEIFSVTHFQVGLIKAPFMALVIAMIACVEGLEVEGSAESLGHHTTTSVVKAIFMIIVLDGLFAVFFAGIDK